VVRSGRVQHTHGVKETLLGDTRILSHEQPIKTPTAQTDGLTASLSDICSKSRELSL
jgi:hypothetical protein